MGSKIGTRIITLASLYLSITQFVRDVNSNSQHKNKTLNGMLVSTRAEIRLIEHEQKYLSQIKLETKFVQQLSFTTELKIIQNCLLSNSLENSIFFPSLTKKITRISEIDSIDFS